MRPGPLLLSPLLLPPHISSSRPSVFKRTLDLRQSCPSGEKECGQYCIVNSYSCCPDRNGGCPSSEYCSLGDNGQYGCCPNKKVCTGNGGASVTGTDYYTSTSTDYYYSSTYSSSPASATALDCDSYTLTAASDGAKYSVWCDKNYLGANDLSNVIEYNDGVDTMQECVNRCERTTDCMAADLYMEAYPGFPAGRCFLLSDVSPGYNNKLGVKAASSIGNSVPSTSIDDSASSSSISLSVPTLSPLPSITPLSSSTSSSAAVGTSTATVSSSAVRHLSPPYEQAQGLAWHTCSTTMAVTMFLIMIWL